jgi:two-component system, OmpR family, response regulator
LKKILVVDDTKNIRNLLTTCLELRKYEVCAAKNGMEAIELITNENFDLAFLDVKMPELSGTEVLKKIRDLGYTYPVVMMTAYATVKNAVECTRLGAVAYLQKPFTVDKVNEVVDGIYNRDLEKSSFDNMLNRAKELIESGKNTDAYNLLKKCLSIYPDNKDVYYYMGKVYENRNEQDEAQKFYQASNLFSQKD